MGRRTRIKAFMIFVTFLANILVLYMILSESDKGQVEAKEEIVEEEKQQPIDLEKFDIDEDGGYWVIEAILVPEEWR